MSLIKTALKGVGKTAFLPYGIATTAISKIKGGAAQKQQTKEILAGAGIGTAAVGLAVAPLAIAKAIIPTSLKGKIIAGVSAPIIAGAVIAQPKKSAETLAKAPGELAQFGGDLANLAADPSLANVKTLVSESPLIVGAIGAAGLITAGKGLVTAVALSKLGDNDTPVNNIITPEKTKATTAPLTPITPETQVLGKAAGSQTRSVAKRKKIIPQTIRQSVKVNVLNANQSRVLMKRYLN